MATPEEEKERNAKLKEGLSWLPVLGALHPHPAVRATAWGLGAMLGIGGLHSAWDNGERVPNQPDDFGNYYGGGQGAGSSDEGRKIDDMVSRVMGARGY